MSAVDDELSSVNIVMFKGNPCELCAVVEPIIRKIVATSPGSTTLTFIDEKEEDLFLKYNVTTIPVVLYNDKLVLSAEDASELVEGEFGTRMVGKNINSITSSMEDQHLKTDVNYGSEQSGLFNHLFNSLIESSIDSNAEMLSRIAKYNMIAISEKTMTYDAIQTLNRKSLGDYVHIGILQSVVTSILSINPKSKEFLYNLGRSMGLYGNIQYRFLKAYSTIHDEMNPSIKFQMILEGLVELYSANSLGLPLYVASKSFYNFITNTHGELIIYESAFCASIPPIDQPVCYIIAGEISGLLETLLGEDVSVIETKCYGSGNPFCKFSIEVGKELEFSFKRERSFLTKNEKEKFQRCLNGISKNMYGSSLIRSVLRPGITDYVHISVLQQTVNGIKFSDPFFSTLLFYAGLHYGKQGADFAILERVLHENDITNLPLEFEKGVQIICEYFNDPATILSRWQGSATLTVEDNETARLHIYESAIAAGLDMTSSSSFIFGAENETHTLCNFTAGFIQGRLSRILVEKIDVVETTCLSMGSKYCEFTITIR